MQFEGMSFVWASNSMEWHRDEIHQSKSGIVFTDPHTQQADNKSMRKHCGRSKQAGKKPHVLHAKWWCGDRHKGRNETEVYVKSAV